MAMLPGLAEQFPSLKEGRCKHIRSKEMFYETKFDHVPDYGARLYWCQHTQTCLGPDGRPCDMDNCSPGRTCFDRL